MIVRYGTRSLIFEPVPSFAEGLMSRFRENDRVVVIHAGLGGSQRQQEIFVDRDGSSIVRGKENPSVHVQLLDVASVFAGISDSMVDCMKINIEGAEYELLDAMISANLLTRVRALLIQFHDIGSGSHRSRAAIQDEMSKTHECVFDYEFLWERWDVRD